ncbi:S49 family peptidase [Pelagibius sp. Alg239-R121]|uniref:S49 family peptidase n=1 Tax=Pelagibius sp. Alg239-R121 TaxID=2993448 RepID=UPI0024A6D8F9|nr:S49 family peptidase [Pelagibius sp. Alg239-R121]
MKLKSLLSFLPIKAFKETEPVVAVIRLNGVIGAAGPLRGGMTLAGLEKRLDQAFKIKNLEAVALAINSPGGSPVQSDLIAKRIRDLAGEKSVPVYAFCEDVAASGGYWLACAADHIYAQESSIVGSIGVISSGFGFPAVLERFGIERRVRTAGHRKSTLDPFEKEDPEDIARLEGILKELHETFKNMVTSRRKDRLKEEPEVLFSGEFWTGTKAVEMGLIDGIGELRSTMRERFGEKVKLMPLEDARPWWRKRMGFGATGGLGEILSGGGLAAVAEPQEWVQGLVSAAEERALWSRFGL